MINYIESEIVDVCIHHVDTMEDGQGLVFSKSPVFLKDESIRQFLKEYFFSKMKEPSFYNFKINEDESNDETNLCYQYAGALFENQGEIFELSKKISKHLYNTSHHPNIKSGDLITAYIKDVLIDDEMIDAICIFKSEYKHNQMTIDLEDEKYNLALIQGILPDKIDKGCIIFNTEKEDGYKMCVIDKTNSGEEARFWMIDFLNAVARSDDYNHTKNYIKATKDFIDERVKPIYEIEKADEAHMLKSSLDFFNNEDSFESNAYADAVFQDERIVNDFKSYKKDYASEKDVDLVDNFAVNMAAVKNQSKVFKSVLKLDKNFHVYIHGDRSFIEKGRDENGRKYYKLFYEDEK